MHINSAWSYFIYISCGVVSGFFHFCTQKASNANCSLCLSAQPTSKLWNRRDKETKPKMRLRTGNINRSGKVGGGSLTNLLCFLFFKKKKKLLFFLLSPFLLSNCCHVFNIRCNLFQTLGWGWMGRRGAHTGTPAIFTLEPDTKSRKHGPGQRTEKKLQLTYKT